MLDPAWRDELQAELTRRRLPASYVERLVQELCDHHEDVLKETKSMDADPQAGVAKRIGTPDQLAAVAAIAYQQQHISLRQGLVTYAALPVLLPIVIWCSLMGAAYLIGVIFDPMHESEASTSQAVGLETARLIDIGFILLPIALSSILFGRLARRNGVDWRWPLLTTCLLACFAGLIFSTVIPWGAAREPRLAFCVGVPFTIQQSLHSLTILAVGGWTCSRAHRVQIAV